MDIIWHGHACFEVRGQNSTIVFDPFGGIGIPEPKAKAGIVLCSHSHGDHNNVRPVLKEGGVVLEGFVGAKEVEDILVKGVATQHDAAGGSQRGKNSVYTVQLEDDRRAGERDRQGRCVVHTSCGRSHHRA